MAKWKADKVSGIQGKLFALSVILEVVKKCGDRCPYAFPFYGLTLDISKAKCDEWIIDAEFAEVSSRILKDVREKGAEAMRKLQADILRETDELQQEAWQQVGRLSSYSDDELLEQYNQFMRQYFYSYGLGALTFIYEQQLSEKLHSSLENRGAEAAEIISTVLKTDYVSFMIAAERRLVAIGREKNKSKRLREANRYIKDFFYMEASYYKAPVLTAASVGEDADNRAEAGEEVKKSVAGNVEVNLTDEERTIVELLKITEPMRDQRKRLNLIGSYTMFRFLDEAVKRTGFKIELAPNIYWYEFWQLVKEPTQLYSVVRSRRQVSLVHEPSGKLHYLDGILIEPRQVVDKNVTEVKGVPASRGKVIGVVKVVLEQRDFEKLQEGDVLVAEMTRPDFVALMKKSAAIITDEGSLTSHAAIVSRELGIPCIVGTKVATQVLKDGDIVEVDAEKGIVKIVQRGED